MKIFWWYAGILTAAYFSLVIYVVLGGRIGRAPQDPRSAGDLLMIVAVVGFPVLILAILTGGSAMNLWRKFIAKDPSVSQTLWVLSAVWMMFTLSGIVNQRSLLFSYVRAVFVSSPQQPLPPPTDGPEKSVDK